MILPLPGKGEGQGEGMYRRRRLQRDKIAFSFDSFLDVVANVCGIIIRLILVAWVGGRSYSALMDAPQAPAPSASATQRALRPEDDPLHFQIQETQRELDAARAKLLAHLQDTDLLREKRRAVEGQVTALARERALLSQERQDLDRAGARKDQVVRLAALSMEELRRRQQALLEHINQLKAVPAPTKELRYHTPVSRAVHADEVFFECRHGRVTFIDLPAFLQEAQGALEGRAEELRTRFKVDDATRPVGAFRLRYTIERDVDVVDAFGGAARPSGQANFRFGLTGWVVEPVTLIRGETLDAALAPKSDFRRTVDALDNTTVITLWVYPDSFEMFRRLRDHLYERGLEVAGRPLPDGAPIAASRNGSASRGQ